MLKVWSLKKDEETAKKKKPKTSPAQLRVQKGESCLDQRDSLNMSCTADIMFAIFPPLFLLFLDLTEMELPSTMKTDFPDPSDVLNFKLTIEPDEGKDESFDHAYYSL